MPPVAAPDASRSETTGSGLVFSFEFVVKSSESKGLRILRSKAEGWSGREACVWHIDGLHALHQRRGEPLLDQPVVELLGIARLIWPTSGARLCDEDHRVFLTPCGGDGVAKRTIRILLFRVLY